MTGRGGGDRPSPLFLWDLLDNRALESAAVPSVERIVATVQRLVG
jgi:hypothetical protein